MGKTARKKRNGTGPFKGSFQQRKGGGRKGQCYKKKK